MELSDMSSKTRKRIIIAAASIAALLLVLFGIYKLMNARTFQLFGTLVTHVETDEKTVYLTFDDGPTEKAGLILDVLAAHDVKSTFFLIGKEMEAHTELTRQIVEAGHDVGNHSYTHTRLVFLPYHTIKEEVDKTNTIIRNFGYDKEIYFRAPGCKKLFFLPWHLSKIGQTSVIYTLEPESDPAINTDAASIANHVIENAQEGSIILLHPMYGESEKIAEAVQLIIIGLKEKGYSFGTLSEGFGSHS